MDFMSLRSQNCWGQKDASSIAICAAALCSIVQHCALVNHKMCAAIEWQKIGVMVTGVDAVPACLGVKTLARSTSYINYTATRVSHGCHP